MPPLPTDRHHVDSPCRAFSSMATIVTRFVKTVGGEILLGNTATILALDVARVLAERGPLKKGPGPVEKGPGRPRSLT